MAVQPYSISFSKGNNLNTIELNGNLVINHIEKIYSELTSQIDFSKNLKLIITEVDSIDITFVQLIFGIKKEFAQLGKTLNIELNINEDLSLLLNNAGFNNKLIN